jgi:putative transcriptional regulator
LILIIWTERHDETIRSISARWATKMSSGYMNPIGDEAMTEMPELTSKDLARSIPARVRKRLMLGQVESGEDIVALRRFIGLTQAQFARAMAISVHTLRNWEQGRRHPDGPALALLRIAARHPRIIRENLESAA